MRTRLSLVAILAALSVSAAPQPPDPPKLPPRVLVITHTDEELQLWASQFKLLSQGDPGTTLLPYELWCNADLVCAVELDPGKAKAAARLSALAYSRSLDLSSTYFVIAELVRIDPARGSLGSIVWVTGAVDTGIAWELDARSLPAGWTTGYLGIDASSPTDRSPVMFGTEAFTLDPALIAKASALASNVSLAFGTAALAYGAQYTEAAAQAMPSVFQGATATSDTYWHGVLLGQRARDWVTLVGGGATYTTMQKTDNALIGVLMRAGKAGKLDGKRIAVVHVASAFDRQHPGQTALDSFTSDPGGHTIAMTNIALVVAPLVADIVANWSAWQQGVPP